MPLTEIYVFNHEKVATSPDSISYLRANGFTVFPGNFYSKKFEEYIETEKDGIPIRGEYPSSPIGFNYSYAAVFSHFSMGYNIGFRALGVNSTLRVIGKNYLTVNAAAVSGVEFVLQRPVLHQYFQVANKGTHEFNATLGFYSKAKNLRYDPNNQNEALFTLPQSEFIYHWGLRSFFQFRNLSDDNIFVGFISTGYAPELDDFIVNFGMTVAVARFRK